MISRQLEEKAVKCLLWFFGASAFLILVAIFGHVLKNGLPVITLEFLFTEPRHMGMKGGILSISASTVFLTLGGLLLAVPIGVGAAIYTTEYLKKRGLLRLLAIITETLAGIPSIIYGLFGFVFFVIYLGWGWSVLSGACTLAIMILPILIRTTEESLKAVPASYREGSLALGASKWQTIRLILLPEALRGIITGTILGTGRAVGETAAVLLTAGSALGMPHSVLDPARAMPVHLYILASEGLSMEKSYGTAAVLITAVLLLNLTVRLLRRKEAS